MATLTADVTAEATSWNVSALPNVNYLQVDDEIVHVLDQKRTQNRIRVERGYAGTTAATHDSGAELVPVYVPSVAGEGAGGFSLLGPFHIAFDSPADPETGFMVTEPLEAGQILLQVLVTRGAFDTWDTGVINVGVYSADGVNGRTILATEASELDAGDGPAAQAGANIPEGDGAGVPLFVIAAGFLSVWVTGTPATGEADVYAWIVEVAA